MNMRRANRARREKVTRRVKAEESVCWLCGQWVDPTLGMQPGKHGRRCRGEGCMGCVPDPMRAEVDEIVPVSKGGSPYDRDNCRLAHRICNQRRGNRAPGAQRKPVIPLVTERDWS